MLNALPRGWMLLVLLGGWSAWQSWSAHALAADKTLVATVTKPGDWRLVWHDEFDGDTLDRTKWDFDLGNGFYDYQANVWQSGWGNGELQYYTREPSNVFVSDGELKIRALRESFDGCGYTSARLKTRQRDGTPLMARTYGRFEIRAKLPVGQGVWPAIWMLPADDKYGTWAASGEIDILEAKGGEPDKIHGTLHHGGRWPINAQSTTAHQLKDGGRIDQFHIYAVEWDPNEIRWYVDGDQFAQQSSWWTSKRVEEGKPAAPRSVEDLHPWPAPFDQPFYLLMNVAVGGQFGGEPSLTTPFPATMEVDWVRIFERSRPLPAPSPRAAGKLPFEK